MDETHVDLFFKWLIYKPMCLNIPFLIDLHNEFIKINLTEKGILDGLPDVDLRKGGQRNDEIMTENLNKPGPSTDSNTNPMILRSSKIFKNVQINKECRVNQNFKGCIKKKKNQKKIIIRSTSSSTKSDDELTMLTMRYTTSTPAKSAGNNILRRSINGGAWHIMPIKINL